RPAVGQRQDGRCVSNLRRHAAYSSWSLGVLVVKRRVRAGSDAYSPAVHQHGSAGGWLPRSPTPRVGWHPGRAGWRTARAPGIESELVELELHTVDSQVELEALTGPMQRDLHAVLILHGRGTAAAADGRAGGSGRVRAVEVFQLFQMVDLADGLGFRRAEGTDRNAVDAARMILAFEVQHARSPAVADADGHGSRAHSKGSVRFLFLCLRCGAHQHQTAHDHQANATKSSHVLPPVEVSWGECGSVFGPISLTISPLYHRPHLQPANWRVVQDAGAAAGAVSSAFCTRVQVESGSKRLIARALAAVSRPRSFSNTTPSWFTMKVMIPELPYSAGYATSAKRPIILPRTT